MLLPKVGDKNAQKLHAAALDHARLLQQDFIDALGSDDVATKVPKDAKEEWPKFVASTTMKEPLEWNSTLLEGNVVEAVANLKEQAGDDILVYGSGALVNALLPHKLIDEYRLMIYPLVLGTGLRFFKDDNSKAALTLKRAETASTGVAMLVLEPIR